MKLPYIIFICLLTLNHDGISQDSVQFKGKSYKTYPYSQVVDLHLKKFRIENNNIGDVMSPLSTLDDGLYIQMAKINIIYRCGLKSFKYKRSRTSLPYAVIPIKNGKINGEVKILDASGEVEAKGMYRDNLLQGVWYYGAEFKNYVTYDEGILQGVSYSEQIFKSRNGLRKKTLTEDYVDGHRVKYLIDREYKDYKSKEVYDYIDGDGDRELYYRKSFVNNVLLEEGAVHREIIKRDAWKYYFKSTGELKSEVRYHSSKEGMKRYFYFWLENLEKPINEDTSFVVEGISTSYFAYSSGDDLFTKESNLFYYLWGSGKEYYPNGQLKISYELVDSGLYQTVKIDTLYHINGAPKYFVKLENDTLTAQHFDLSGNLYKSYNEHVLKGVKSKPSEIQFKGLTLYYNSRHNNYKYEYFPPFDSIANPANGVVYSLLEVHNNEVVNEIFYDTPNRQKVMRFDMQQSSHSLPYDVEIIYRYNADYTKADVTYKMIYNDRFKCISNFKTTLNRHESFGNSDTNVFDVENDFKEHFNGDEQRAFYYYNHLNYVDPLMTIDSLETTYYLDDEKFTGKFRLKTKDKPKVKLSKRAVKISYYHFEKQVPHRLLTFDRAGIERVFAAQTMVPDILYYIPGFYRSVNWSYRLNIGHQMGNGFKSNLEKIKGEFVNGKVHGKWRGKNKANQFKSSFKNGLPTGKTKSSIWRKGVYQTIENKNGQISTLMLQQKNKDTLLFIKYQDGSPTYVKSYIKHTLMRQAEIFTPYEEAYFNANKLDSITYSFVDWDNGEIKTRTIKCIDERLDGEFEYEYSSGYFEKGVFTGSYSIGHVNNDKKYYRFQNGWLSQIDTYKSDGVLKRSTFIDTLEYKSVIKYNMFILPLSLARPPQHPSAFDVGWDSTTTSYLADHFIYYSNGIPRVKTKQTFPYGQEGLITLFENESHYDPQGKLIYEMKDGYFITHYTDGIMDYRGVLSGYVDMLYDCDENEYYHLQSLNILTDYKENGDSIVNPTRYHRNYYDSGILQSEGELINGLPEGLWRFYDFEGGLYAVGNFTEGKMDGRWLKGDLEGVAFIGDFCLNPNTYQISESYKDELKKNLSINVVMYKMGEEVSKSSISGYVNDQ